MPEITLVYDRVRWEEKAIVDAAEKRGIAMSRADAKSIYLDALEESELERKLGKVILQRCMSYFRGLYLTALLEEHGKEVINKFSVAQICGNKLLTSMTLSKAKIPTPKTKIAFTPETAIEAINEIGYPAVLKPVVGSWGRHIVPLRNKDIAEAVFEDRQFMYPLYQIYYIQEMIDRPPRDLRVVMVGDEIAASTYRYAATDKWKTNIAVGGKAAPCPVTKELEDLCSRASQAVGGGILGIDLMESSRGLLVHEVNHTVEFKGAQSATKTSIASKIIDYALSKVKELE
jgi:[lysine-biosynthesis-protein LysW]--L-2-aminoadipate ligase